METQSESPVSITPDQAFIIEAHERFTAFLQVWDCKSFLQILGVRRVLFVRYKRAVNACRAAAVVLWYHALLRSFPVCATTMLETCINETLPSLYPPASVKQMEGYIRHFLECMQEKGDGDFTVTAHYILEIAGKSRHKNVKVLQLKLVLYLRKQYAILYDGLI